MHSLRHWRYQRERRDAGLQFSFDFLCLFSFVINNQYSIVLHKYLPVGMVLPCFQLYGEAHRIEEGFLYGYIQVPASVLRALYIQ